MYAVVGSVSITAGREEEGTEYLRANIIPMVKQAPGVVSAYWLAPQDGHGFGIILFEIEEAARAGAERARDAIPEFVSMDSLDVREVVAQI
jgi:hypothetical protein